MRAAEDGLCSDQATYYGSYRGSRCELSPLGLKAGGVNPKPVTISSIPDSGKEKEVCVAVVSGMLAMRMGMRMCALALHKAVGTLNVIF